MAHIVILGAGIGGMPMAYELKPLLREGDHITVVSNTPTFHFVPSNPWVAVNWRTRDAIEFEAAPYLARQGIAFVALPQIPPRNVSWFAEGKWVHLAKVAFEKYFMRKMFQSTPLSGEFGRGYPSPQ